MSDKRLEAVAALAAEAAHIDHVHYENPMYGNPNHMPGSDLYCPACWVFSIREALGTPEEPEDPEDEPVPVLDLNAPDQVAEGKRYAEAVERWAATRKDRR